MEGSAPQIGDYRVVRTIGAGMTSKVKLAEDVATGRRVAIKIMNK
jgi:serine/threonine protein kinase